MRVRAKSRGLKVFAFSGTNVCHLGFDVTDSLRQRLLGFALARLDKSEGESEPAWTLNRRTFAGQEGDQNRWPTSQAPIQKFRWGDYTVKPGHDYVYEIYPAYGRPGGVRLGRPATIEISTERPDSLIDPGGTRHQVFFSRGAAASQAYVRRFGNRRPDEVPGGAALTWLSRGLLEGMLAFIDGARQGDELHVAIYEFQYEPILKAFKAAVDRGVTVKILYDAGSAKTGPLKENESAIVQAGLKSYSKPRAGLRGYISHHKFIVHVRSGKPISVWTGSTNMSLNGIYAQLNVGHALDAAEIAGAYLALHAELWTSDPDAKATRLYMTTTYPKLSSDAQSTSFVFSPRGKDEAMELYLELMRKAKQLVILTTPFGVDKRIEQFLETSSKKVIKFGLTGSADRYGGDVKRIDSLDGTRYAMPARIDSVLDRWQIEQFGLTSHAYIHTKFLLRDPFSEHPLVVTGSANFSRSSSVNNDENMLLIYDHPAVADIYLTEFLRMFEHYAFRQLVEEHRVGTRDLALAPDSSWTAPYFRRGSERAADRIIFSGQQLA
jgi:phosphatidylserine/phosphatidylglycerophosphate/cardiolipin synthase-like enzyme